MGSQVDRDKLLAALAELPRGRAHALATLPGVLARGGEGHASVTLRHADGALTLAASNDPNYEAGVVVPADGVVALAARQREPVYLTDAPNHPNYRSLGGIPRAVEFALPILERGEVVAILNIERDQRFSSTQRKALKVFVNGVSHQLTQASHSLEARISSALSSKIAGVSDLRAAASLALDVITAALGASASNLMRERGSRLIPLAHSGSAELEAALSSGTPYPNGVAWTACLSGAPYFTRDYSGDDRSLESLRSHVRDTVVAVPVGSTEPYRTALCLHFTAGFHVSAADIEMLRSVCRHLAAALNVGSSAAVQERLLYLHARALQEETPNLYQEVLDAAILHVPGAEAGSLLVRSAATDDFRYVATNGFDLELLEEVAFTEAQMRAWHAKGAPSWGAGEARILHASEKNLAEVSRRASGSEAVIRVGNLETLKGNACLPVTYMGEVLAMLNLDTFTRERGFGQDSLDALALFGPPVAAILAGNRHRNELAKASRTDALTGLLNRAGFTQLLEGQHARSARTNEPYTLLMMDLSGFKRVNDAFGHAVGDATLVSVARALEVGVRGGDTLSRWGGDEFIALLPSADPQDVGGITRRFKREVADLVVGGLRLGIDIGAATYPHDALTPDALISAADERMYENKRRRREQPQNMGPPHSS